MIVLLPILFVAFLWPILALRLAVAPERRPTLATWGEALLAAAVVTALTVVAGTELLSPWGALGQIQLLIFWGLALLAVWLVGLKKGFARPSATPLAALKSLDGFERTALVLLVALVAALGLLALLAVPNNRDAMTYHLARVAHWVQNGGIAFYPTSIMRQNHQTPLAEYCLLHLRLLGGSYQGVNLVQWCSMVGSLAGIALIARHWGGSRRALWLALFFAATLPMGLLQAFSPQNDYVAGFWLICFVYFGLKATACPVMRWFILLAASLALAVLTKATNYCFALPFAIWFGVVFLRRLGRRAWKPALVAVAFMLAVNGGHYARNQRLYGNPLGPGREIVKSEEYPYLCDTPGLGPTLSNLMRNLALHLATPLPAWNGGVERAVAAGHRLLSADPNDPRTTWLHERFGVQFLNNENFVGNPLHLFFLGFAGLAGLAATARKGFQPRGVWIYGGCLLGAAVLFCALLRWQPWNSRLHLPLFLLAAPWAAAMLPDRPAWRFVSWAALAMFALMAPACVLTNTTHPFFGTYSIFKSDRKEWIQKTFDAGKFLAALDYVADRGCRRAGLIIDGDTAEFPIYLIQEELSRHHVRFDHVNVDNASRALGQPFRPDYVFFFGLTPPGMLTVEGKSYVPALASQFVFVYKVRE